MYKSNSGVAAQSYKDDELNMLRERYKKMSPEEQHQLKVHMLEAYATALGKREQSLSGARPGQSSTHTNSTALAKRPASTDTQPGQPKISTASRQAKPAPAPLAAAPVKPGTATAQQPVKAPAAGQGTFKLSPAEMTKRVDVEVRKIIAEVVAEKVKEVRPSKSNQIAVYERNLEKLTAYLTKRLYELFVEPAHKDSANIVLKAATEIVKKPAKESGTDKVIREGYISSAKFELEFKLLDLDPACTKAINTLTGRTVGTDLTNVKVHGSSGHIKVSPAY